MSPKNILIVQTAFLGDVILTTGLIRGTHQVFPEAAIDVLVIPQTAGVLKNNPYIREILIFDKRSSKLKAFRQTLKRLRAKRYDVVITPHRSFTTGMLIQLAGIPVRVGFDVSPIRHFLTHRVAVPATGHTSEKNVHLLSVFGRKRVCPQSELFPSDQDKAKVRLLMNNFPGRRPTIAIAPGSVWQTKRWPKSYFVELTSALKDDFNLVFIGSKEERHLCAEIIDSAGARTALNFAGLLSILESAAIIEQCDLMLCNDSGALHIANAVQTDVFAFFGPTIQSFGFYPYRSNDYVFEVNDLYCRPCGKHGHKSCPEKHFRCMLEITPQMVVEKVSRYFQERNAKGTNFEA